MLFWSEDFKIIEIEVLVETTPVSNALANSSVMTELRQQDVLYILTLEGTNCDIFLIASLRVLKHRAYGNNQKSYCM